MTDFIPINLAVEDELSEAVLRRILQCAKRKYAIGNCYSRGGYGYLKRTIRGFNAAAKVTPFLVLVDLDKAGCAPELLAAWFPDARNPNLLFRIAVREVEAWLIAHRDGIAEFLRVSRHRVPASPEIRCDSTSKGAAQWPCTSTIQGARGLH